MDRRAVNVGKPSRDGRSNKADGIRSVSHGNDTGLRGRPDEITQVSRKLTIAGVHTRQIYRYCPWCASRYRIQPTVVEHQLDCYVRDVVAEIVGAAQQHGSRNMLVRTNSEGEHLPIRNWNSGEQFRVGFPRTIVF
jgi:hypothetical protein